MSEKEVDPPIHIVPEGDKWRICLSRLGKWIAGITASVVVAVLVGALAFAWSSNEMLGRIDERLSGIEESVREQAARNDKRIDRLEAKHGL